MSWPGITHFGTSGAKMGNVQLKWAFSEAAVTFLRHNREGQRLLARLEKQHGKGKALSILAHTIGRAVYDMLSRGIVCSRETFLAASRGEGGMSHTSTSSHRDRVRQGLRRTVRPSALRDQEPMVRQRAALMGHSPSPRHAPFAFPLDAAPPPSLETTDAPRRRRVLEEAGTRARLSF